MLLLDDEDYAALGYGSEAYLWEVAVVVSRRRVQVQRAQKTYAKTPKGKDRSRAAWRAYYARNADKVKAKVKKWRAGLDEAGLKKQKENDAARQRRRYWRKKSADPKRAAMLAERERRYYAERKAKR